VGPAQSRVVCPTGLGEELEKAWENYYEVQGYSPFATCGNNQELSNKTNCRKNLEMLSLMR